MGIFLAAAMFVFVIDTSLQDLSAGQPPDIREEIIDINTDARHIALQVALLVTLVAALGGVVNAARMRRLPDPEPSAGDAAIFA